MEDKPLEIKHESPNVQTLVGIFDKRLKANREESSKVARMDNLSPIDCLSRTYSIAVISEEEVKIFLQLIPGRSEEKIFLSLGNLMQVIRDYLDEMEYCMLEAFEPEVSEVIEKVYKNLKELSFDIYRAIYLQTLSRLSMNTKNECESRILREVSEVFDEWRRANLETEWQLYEMAYAVDLDDLSQSFRAMSSIGTKVGNFIELMRGEDEKKISEYLKSLTITINTSSGLIESCDTDIRMFFRNELDESHYEGLELVEICEKLKKAVQALRDLASKLSNILDN